MESQPLTSPATRPSTQRPIDILKAQELTLKATAPRTTKSLLVREQLALGGPRLRESSLIALEAPAGYGKTSQLTQWRREALARGAICAWLTLDERDTPDRLVRGLHTALSLGCGTPPGAVALERTMPPGQDPIEGAISWLAETSALASEVVLFLDDVHVLQDESARQLLAHIAINAPANLVIVFASRRALRSAKLATALPGTRLITLTAADLRLGALEAERLLQLQVDSRLEPGAANRLYELSGGWPLGLQLIASALRRSSGSRLAVDSSSIDTGEISRYFQQCLDDRLSPQQMHFLLQISVVDCVTPELCALLTGRPDAVRSLEELCSTTPLFCAVAPHDRLRMHALALDYLRERASRLLPPAELERIHVAACHWFEAQGMPEPAARHALAGACADLAFDLAERAMPDLIKSGDFTRLREWITRIPQAEILKRPGIAMSAIWTLAFDSNSRTRADALIASVLDSALATPAIKAAASAALLYLAEHDDAAERGEAYMQQCPPHLDDPHGPLMLMRTIVRLNAMLHEGRPAEARQLCERVLAEPSTAEIFNLHLGLAGLLGHTYFWEGRVEMAEDVFRAPAEEARARFGRRSIKSTSIDLMLATVLLERGEHAEASRLMADRVDVIEQMAPFQLVMLGHLTLARIEMHEHNESRALQILDKLFAIGQLRAIPRLCWESLAEQVRMHAHSGRARTCGALMERLEAIASSEAATRNLRARPLLDVRLAISRAYACIAQQEFQSALRHLQAAAELAHRVQLRREVITTQLLHALCKRRLGETHEALLAEALSLAELLGLKRIIRDTHPDIEAMIDAVRGSAPAPDATARATGHAPAATLLPVRGATVQIMPSALLTPKEREVLRHLAEGCANKRIANILEISDETVKWHVKNLSAKFGGANRRHVVDRARQMGIIA